LNPPSYKLGALEIEREVLNHPKVVEAVVVGVPDVEYGQRVAAGGRQNNYAFDSVLLLYPIGAAEAAPSSTASLLLPVVVAKENLELKELQKFCSKTLAKYKLPTLLQVRRQLLFNTAPHVLH
jgi:acyl-CoA synthetase (AMP-forming)/AMP-acid ligase II